MRIDLLILGALLAAGEITLRGSYFSPLSSSTMWDAIEHAPGP